MQTSGLAVSLRRILHDDRLDLLATSTGLDLRDVPELALASYRGVPDDTTLYLARHGRDPLVIERLFRRRLTGEEARAVDGEGLVRVSGIIGDRAQAFATLGSEVVAFQYGGSRQRGPARVAMLYAAGELGRVPRLLHELDPVSAGVLTSNALVRALLAGPFEGDLAQGARGLLAAATDVTAAFTPAGDAASLRLEIHLVGDYASDPVRAAELLLLAWQDVATSDLGSLLSLSRPRAPARTAAVVGGLGLVVDLDAKALFDGLAAATLDSIRTIMAVPATPEP